MSSELPACNGKEVIAALERAGFVVARIEGSHHVMKKAGHRFLLTVPVHGAKALPRGTLVAIIRGSGLTKAEFSALL